MKHAWLAAIFLAAAAVVLADKVVLNDGREYEGLIVEENDKQVKIKTSKATLSFPRDQIRSVEKGSSAVAERVTRLEGLEPENLQGYLDAAEWFAGDGKIAADLPTMKRVCNIASRDRAVACRAQTILGDYLVGQGDRLAAAGPSSAPIQRTKNEEAAKRRRTRAVRGGRGRDLRLSDTVKMVIDADTRRRFRSGNRRRSFSRTRPAILHQSCRCSPTTCSGGWRARPAPAGPAALLALRRQGLPSAPAATARASRDSFRGRVRRFSEKVYRSCVGMGSLRTS